MPTNLKFILAAVCLLALAYTIQGAHQHLQCWHCSSDTVGAADFCSEIFSEDSMPTEMRERNITAIRSCNSTINSDQERAVCRKTVEETADGKTITKRFCYYNNKSDTLEHCNEEPTDKNVRRTFCQDCLTDRCNSATQQVATLGIVLLPVLLAKSVVV